MKVAQPQILRTMSNSNMVNFLHQKASIVGQMANLVNRCVSTKEIPKFSYEQKHIRNKIREHQLHEQ